MTETELKELVLKVKSAQAEFQTVEVKRSKDFISDKLYDTLSSFSNQNDGVVIIFGLYEKRDIFQHKGVWGFPKHAEF